ncbi:hypothetical protein NQ318_011388 [Aromia moschata]|uniref:Uncharacterized protein n=1 Tax=Aromia moschata TaxID=1265417 RepID=A0AAV8YVI8_9CUCU|nr:hypothetical protein NQ318_011388 [Aromia moschata]
MAVVHPKLDRTTTDYQKPARILLYLFGVFKVTGFEKDMRKSSGVPILDGMGLVRELMLSDLNNFQKFLGYLLIFCHHFHNDVIFYRLNSVKSSRYRQSIPIY